MSFPSGHSSGKFIAYSCESPSLNSVCHVSSIFIHSPRLQNPLTYGIVSYHSCPLSGCFAGLGFLSWYLAGKIKVFDRRGHVAKLCLVLLPLLLASMVAVSRVSDYWHHWQDVFAGGLLGMYQVQLLSIYYISL